MREVSMRGLLLDDQGLKTDEGGREGALGVGRVCGSNGGL
jgi:hypothetical protein